MTPIAIGIAGDSATGKSTFANLIKDNIFKDNSIIIEGDNYHKWERNDKHWKQYTHLNPKANFLNAQVNDLINLKKCNSITMLNYNHEIGQFTNSQIIYPQDYIIINGLHTLFLYKMRNYLDFKIYMDAEQSLKVFWKVNRDCLSRNKSVYDILNSIQKRQCDYYKYIYPQIEYADMSIYYFDNNLVSNKKLFKNSNYIPKVNLRISCNIKFNIEKLVNVLKKYKIGITCVKKIKKQILIFYYEEMIKIKTNISNIFNDLDISNFEFSNIKSDSNEEIIIQLMFVILLNEKKRIENKC